MRMSERSGKSNSSGGGGSDLNISSSFQHTFDFTTILWVRNGSVRNQVLGVDINIVQQQFIIDRNRQDEFTAIR